MRLVSFNILHGRSLDDGVVDPDRLRSAVQELDPDVLALQEVDCDQSRSGGADLTAVAAEAMGAVSHRFVATVAGTPGATWVAATGHEPCGTPLYGIALLSRHPVTDWGVLRLPRIPLKLPLFIPGPDRVQIVDEEPRAAVLARVDTPLGPLTVGATHLSFVPGWNRMQLRRLRYDLAVLPGPRVLMGDLNMTGSAPARCTGMHPLADVATFPRDRPVRRIDHVLTDDPGLQVTHCAAERTGISDHRALVVDVQRRDV